MRIHVLRTARLQSCLRRASESRGISELLEHSPVAFTLQVYGHLREGKLLIQLARPERLELPTYWFEASRSIHLSYGRAPLQCRPVPFRAQVRAIRYHDPGEGCDP